MNTRVPLAKMLTFGLLPGCLKKAIYRLKGNKIGRHVKLHLGAVVSGKKRFIIGDYTEIGYFTSISGQNVSIGKRCNIRSAVIINVPNIVIGNEVTISETAIIRAGHPAKDSELIVDDLVHIFPHATIDASRRVHLGEECAVGPRCSIFTHGSYKNILDGYPVTYGDVNIGKRVELTYNVFVAPGVTVGDDAVIAYGSYVNKNIPSGVLAAGCPAVVKRTKEQFAPACSEEEKQAILNQIVEDFKEYASFCNLRLDPESVKVIGIQEVILNGVYHYDLVHHRCTLPDTVLSKELRRFFSRYGIRFKVEA